MLLFTYTVISDNGDSNNMITFSTLARPRVKLFYYIVLICFPTIGFIVTCVHKLRTQNRFEFHRLPMKLF